MTYNRAILSAAGDYLGLEEWPGAKHNPEVVALWGDIGLNVQDDETPWCAAFVGAVLASLGLPHTGKPNARSYEKYGTEVPIQSAQPGDIVVFWRGSPDSWQGHVAFFVRFEGGSVIVRGGNQGNKVSDAPYPTGRIVAIRRADGQAAQPSRPTLRAWGRGAFVLDLQDQLARLRYFLGKIDGIFGPLTREAVLAFQADHGLVVDGIVGPQTWEALTKAEPRLDRNVTEDDLQDSRTIQSANKAATVAGGVVSVAGIGSVVEVVQQLEGAEGALDIVQRLVMDYWPALLVVVGGFVIWHYTRQIRSYRVEDARTGRHLGR